jgi:hypothetical protein
MLWFMDWWGRRHGRASRRKVRLFACACCGSISTLFPDPRIRDLIVLAEQYSDRAYDDPDLLQTMTDLRVLVEASIPWSPALFTLGEFRRAFRGGNARIAATVARNAVLALDPDWSSELPAARPPWSKPALCVQSARQADFARCVFGNPFRSNAVILPAWMEAAEWSEWLEWGDGNVRKLGESAYAERNLPEGTLEPARLTVLADAMEDAGCTHTDVLTHLRSPGPHVRGCWALDLVLRKA